MFNTHALIAINRVWAVLHPISYRTLHSRQFALSACSGLWAYILATNVPFLLLDSAYHRAKPASLHGCYTANDQQPRYAIFLQFTVFIAPLFVLWLALPTLLIAGWRRRQRRSRVVGPSRLVHSEVALRPIGDAGKILPSVPTTPFALYLFTGSLSLPAAADKSVHCASITATTAAKQSSRSAGSGGHGMTLLILLTISVTLTWTPSTVLSTLGIWIPSINTNDLAFAATVALFGSQLTIDPIVFLLALPLLREAVRSCVRWPSSGR